MIFSFKIIKSINICKIKNELLLKFNFKILCSIKPFKMIRFVKFCSNLQNLLNFQQNSSFNITVYRNRVLNLQTILKNYKS